MDKIRFLRQTTGSGYIAEFESGVWHGHHVKTGFLTPNHYRMCAHAALAAGATGWNWYMLVNRDNWYLSPITEWGRKREELFEVFKEIVATFKKLDPPSAKRLTSVGAVYYPPHYALRQIRQESSILQRLCEAEIDYELFNPETDEITNPILFYSGNQWLSKKAHENLRRYVEKGGILVAFQDFPRKDENFIPCSLVGFEEPVGSLFEFKKSFDVKLNSKIKIPIISSAYVFKLGEVQTVTAEISDYGDLKVGYMKKIGKGILLHLGVEPNAELLQAILKHFHISLTPTKRKTE
jgi:hypothetical protein